MTATLAAANSAFLLSPVAPVLMAAALIGWGWTLGKLDKDAAFYYLKQHYWNMAQIGCGIVGFGLMLLIPIFPIGFILGVLILSAGVLGYVYYRNNQVPADERWSLNLDRLRARMAAAERNRAQSRASVVLIDKDESPLTVPAGDDPAAAAHQLLEQVVAFAIPRGADRIDLAVDSQHAKMSVRIDGVKYPQEAPDPQAALALIDYIKRAADLDLADRRKRQRAEIYVDTGDFGRHTLEVITSGSTRGLVLAMEIDTKQRARLPLTQLGLLGNQKEQLDNIIQMAGRVVLVAAPQRHGTTTTLFSLLHAHDPYTTSVMTIEEAKDFELEGVSHNYLPEETDPQQFNEKLGQIIRSDPGVMMLSRFADSQSARLCAKNAQQVRFYVPLAAPDTFATLRAWIKIVGDARLAGSAMGAIIAQRLIRRLCDTCKTPYKPDADALRKLNIPPEKAQQFYAASGKVVVRDKPQTCPDCYGLGYRGRVGVFELMVFDDKARKLAAGEDFDALRSQLRKGRMLYLQEAALSKVVDGTTDIKEVTRALGEGK